MWIRNFILLLTVVASILAGPNAKKGCPKACQCTQVSSICSSLDTGKFGIEVYNLRVHSDTPIILKDNVFKKAGLEGVHTLKFENTTITKIEPSAFAGMDGLTYLNFINCKLPNLEELETSALSKSLQILSFVNSTVVGYEHLALHVLEELEISNCNITEIPRHAFNNMPLLSYISMTNNLIKSFDPQTFNDVTGLLELKLSFNQITEIPNGIFSNLTDLSSLDLSHNPIVKVDIRSSSNLEELILKSCEIDSFNGGQNLDQLVNLELSKNNLESLPMDTFGKMEFLEYVQLSHNQFSTLDEKLFYNNSRLLKLNLDNNNLQRIPKFVTGAGHFQMFHFSCNSCQLDDISNDVFENLPGIVTLNLANNNFKTLKKGVFDNLKSLIELDLSYNKINELPSGIFQQNSQLSMLVLAGNALKEIDTRMFGTLNALKNLDVSNSELVRLWKQPTMELTKLKYLNVANNKNIKSISMKDMEIVKKLKALDVTGIKMECESGLKEAFRWLKKNKVATSVSDVKTHEELNADNFKNSDSISWSAWLKLNCPDDNEQYDDDVTPATESIKTDDYDDDIDIDDDDDDEEDEEEDEGILENDNFLKSDLDMVKELTSTSSEYNNYYLWPTLVFLGTTIIVLIVCSFLILMCIKKRSSPPSLTLSHVQILPWSSGPTIKKHSGSVYRPLSKEMLIQPSTPKFNRYEQVPTHGAQNA